MPSDAKNAYWSAIDIREIEQIVEDIIREEAWWIAARSGKFAQRNLVWADRPAANGTDPSQKSVGDTIAANIQLISK